MPKCIYFYFLKALAAPLLLKAKETGELSSETCAALHQCLELLSKQEEVSKHLRHPTQACINRTPDNTVAFRTQVHHSATLGLVTNFCNIVFDVIVLEASCFFSH